jgi:malate synthase
MDVLSTEVRAFLAQLHEKFELERQQLLVNRSERAKLIKLGIKPKFLEETKSVRDGNWTVAPAPADLNDRRVEITGPAEAKMIINALNCGANVFMADFEDALAPSWSNIIDGQIALSQAVRKTLTFKNEAGKEYRLNDNTATLVVRPRGLHLIESHFQLPLKTESGLQTLPISASLFDFGVYFFHNAKELIKRGSGPYFYLPKMESHLEARWWNKVFNFAQEYVGIPKGTIRATMLIETILAAFEMDEFLFELKDHAAGLNAGRWDYIFSMIKKFNHDPCFILPDRAQVTMAVPFMQNYAKLLVETCHKRGAHAIGGMAAFIPNRKEPEVTKMALEKVTQDKIREASIGFDGSWIAHPDLLMVAKAEFDKVLGKNPNQKQKRLTEVFVSEKSTGEGLIDTHFTEGKITETGVRTNINVSLIYLEKWFQGLGAVAIHNLMEDMATAEISRSQIWQWLTHQVKLADGRVFNMALFDQLFHDELAKITPQTTELKLAADLFAKLVRSNSFPEFLTLSAYEILNLNQDEKSSDPTKEVKETPMFFTAEDQAKKLETAWTTDARWKGIKRTYSGKEVVKLRNSVPVHHSIADFTARRLWTMLNESGWVKTFGALTGGQAVQMVKAGLQSIYLSGWQVAADANLAGQTYPDQSLYPSNSVPQVVKRINNAFIRADQIERAQGKEGKGQNWYAPIVADAEAGFGGPLHAFELMKSMIEAGAAGVHFEDQLAAEKKCGHLAGKVLIPTCNFVRTLQSARLAADVLDVPTVIVARTDALSATLMTSDIDTADREFLTGERTPEGYYVIKGGLDYAIARSLAYAPWADVLWFETSTPDMKEAERFAKEIHAKYPGKLLAYNCSPSFNWKNYLSDQEIAQFQAKLSALGYKFHFITLAGWHLIHYHSFELARNYNEKSMSAYVELQESEFASAKHGYTAVKHQQEVGTGYFDSVLQTISEGTASTGALKGSTEEQFNTKKNKAATEDKHV